MKLNLIQRFLAKFRSSPTPEQIARQLRQPHGRYALKVAEKMNESNEFLYEFTLDSMELAPGESILEIGFGNGRFFDKLFSRAKNLRVSGIDFSEKMVKAAKRNNRSTRATGNLSLYFGNSNHMPFPDNTFDKVFCINVIYFWDPPERHIWEIYRVLKPGGKFYASVRRKDVMEKMPFTRFGFTVYTEQQWKDRLEQYGFSFLESKDTVEPAFQMGDQWIALASQCWIAEKPAYVAANPAATGSAE